MKAGEHHLHNFSVFHGVVNIAGIGGYLSSALKENGFKSTFLVYEDNTTRQNNDVNLKLSQKNFLERLYYKTISFLKSLDYDIVHFYFGQTFFPYGLDLPLLKMFGKKIVMSYCGSDVRLAEIEKKYNKYYFLINYSPDTIDYNRLKKIKIRWQSLFVNKAIVCRNQYLYIEKYFKTRNIIENIWINNSLEMKKYTPYQYTTKKVPTLVHAPSNRAVKGTNFVRKAIKDLKEQGYDFNYLEVHQVPNDEAQRIYREEADIIIDQFIIGAVGSLTLEGMYAGKPVVTYLYEEAQQRFCPDIPIINTTVDDLTEKLAWIIDNPEKRIRLGKLGRKFVERHCDREKIVSDLVKEYELLLTPNKSRKLNE